MSDDARVAQIRRFNRTVTERVGALNDHFLSRGRPLGAARLLWEIGIAGRDVRGLRASLDLDSGYLSRCSGRSKPRVSSRSTTASRDRRVRTAQLTNDRPPRARRARPPQRRARGVVPRPAQERAARRLVAAMAEVERLLTAVDGRDRADRSRRTRCAVCLDEFFAELDRRFDTGFDPALSISADADELRPPAGVFLVARLRGDRSAAAR